MNNGVELTADDIFILGNLGGAAVSAGKGDNVHSILACLQQERPRNAGGFILEAIHLQSQGHIQAAIDVLVRADAFAKDANGEEAAALYALLLVENGQHKIAYQLAKNLLSKDSIRSESARETFATLIQEIDATKEKVIGK